MNVTYRFPMAARGRSLLPWLLPLLMNVGCKRSGPTHFEVEKPPAVAAAALTAATSIYKERCAQCHGETGDGNGPRAASVHPQPRRLTERVWQANVTNRRLRLVITRGGAGVNESPVMPAYPDLAQQPETLDGLVALIRSFAAPE